jgi:undecaprenyl-diphosphatase
MNRFAEPDRRWGWREWDVRVFMWMAGPQTRPAALKVAVAISRWSWVPMLMVVCAMSWRWNHAPDVAFQGLCIAGLAQLACKRLASRWPAARPFSLGLCTNHLNHGSRAGFPSAHAVVMGVLTGFMVCLAPDDVLAVLIGLIALSTAWARVYVGAHFPSDVLVGLALGVAVGAWASRLYL